jgi:anti-sigma regulatory factor (Ser/Thr protein kinase)
MRFTCRELGDAQLISLPILSRLIQTQRLLETDGLKLRLAIQEALLNAVEHGNLELQSTWKEEFLPDGSDKFSSVRRARLQDPHFADRSVCLTTWFNRDTLEIVVKDEGKGFRHSDQAPRVDAGNVSCFGRGMTLICHAVDEVRYSDGGSEVTLIKRLNH